MAADPACVGIGRAKGYIGVMSAHRRILVFVLFLTFALGTPGYGMPPGDMADNALTVTSGAMTPDTCDTCADDMAKSVCVSPCLVVGVLSCADDCLPAGAEEVPGWMPERPTPGAIAAPDPFPPKLFA